MQTGERLMRGNLKIRVSDDVLELRPGDRIADNSKSYFVTAKYQVEPSNWFVGLLAKLIPFFAGAVEIEVVREDRIKSQLELIHPENMEHPCVCERCAEAAKKKLER
jgi:hypothetical protein